MPDHVGATYREGTTSFRVWAPFCENVDVHLISPFDKVASLDKDALGYFEAQVDGVDPGARYYYRLDDRLERADPASRHQPEGVGGPSEVSDVRVRSRAGRPLDEYVIYEAHVGTLTREGTFESAVRTLDGLADLGVTALELMPVAQFPGSRNWGYDGVFPYAPQDTYGGPAGLARLVDECHARGLAVVLDVVYNHMGPEGCHLDDFGPYFTDRYRTPWGRAINFDGRGSDEVRRFFIGNALYWLDCFDIDALRLDAVHAIADQSPLPFVEELAVAAGTLDRPRYLIAESAANDPRLTAPRTDGGFGLDAQWNDDFHHALVSVVTGERDGYYADYGTLGHIARAYRDGFVYRGQFSTFRGHRHGRPGPGVPTDKLVAFSANHDQIGNRMLGDRLSTRVSFEELKLLAGAALLSPSLPLIFMGEEYGETRRFQYFVSHSDPQLIENVRKGRRSEFKSFRWSGVAPDPQSPQTFERSKLDPSRGNEVLRRFYKELLRLRTGLEGPADAHVHGETVVVRRTNGTLVLNFSDEPSPIPLAGTRLIDSADEAWDGPGSTDLLQPTSFILLA